MNIRNKLSKWASIWGNAFAWVIFFLILLVAINYLLFYGYQQANPGQTFWIQLLNYCGSEAFKAVTISLMIPIILAAAGGIFKIGASVDERIRLAREKQTETRLDCIKRMSELWGDLLDLARDVRFFQAGTDKKEDLIKTLKELENYDSPAEELIITWRSRFPNLTDEDIHSFVEFITIVQESAESVAYYILEGEKEISELQDSLGVILDVIKDVSHIQMFSVFISSVELLKDDLSRKDNETIAASIKPKLGRLHDWAELTQGEINSYYKPFPYIQGPEVEAFREAAEKVEKWVRENPKGREYPYYKTDFYPKLQKITDFAHSFNVPYSKECVKNLAYWLGGLHMYFQIKEIVKESK